MEMEVSKWDKLRNSGWGKYWKQEKKMTSPVVSMEKPKKKTEVKAEQIDIEETVTKATKKESKKEGDK